MWIIAYGIIVEKEHYYVNESLVRVVIYCIYSVFTKKVNKHCRFPEYMCFEGLVVCPSPIFKPA